MEGRDIIMQRYLHHLKKKEFTKLSSFFAAGSCVDSPIYGKIRPKDFYMELNRHIRILSIKNAKVYNDDELGKFTLSYKLKMSLLSSKQTVFNIEVVELLEFNESNKISHVKITYRFIKNKNVYSNS